MTTDDRLAAVRLAAETEADKADPITWALGHADRLIGSIVDPWELAYAQRMRDRLAALRVAPSPDADGLRLRVAMEHSVSTRKRWYRTPLVDNLHPVASFVRSAVSSEPQLAWPGEIDTIIEDAESFEEELAALRETPVLSATRPAPSPTEGSCAYECPFTEEGHAANDVGHTFEPGVAPSPDEAQAARLRERGVTVGDGLREARGELQALCAFGERLPWVLDDQMVVLHRAKAALDALG